VFGLLLLLLLLLTFGGGLPLHAMFVACSQTCL
jgi:hypothetical protein